MTEAEVNTFMERMEEMGDVWEESDVLRVYGNKSLEEALQDRRADICWFAEIIAEAIYN